MVYRLQTSRARTACGGILTNGEPNIAERNDTELITQWSIDYRPAVHELPAGHPGPDMESPGIVDQTIPGCPRKERDKKMKRRLKMFFLALL